MHEDVPEYHEVPVAGAIYEGNTQKKPEYFSTIYLDVANIDKMIKNIWRTINKAVDEPYFG